MKIKNIFYVTFLSIGLSISCNGNTPSVTELEIIYTGETEYKAVIDEYPYVYEFTLPFKLSRELKDGEHMDEVVSTLESYISDGANALESKFELNGTSLNLVTTICLNGYGIEARKGIADYSYDINVLNSDGKISKQLNLDMSYEIDIKTVYVDCSDIADKLKEKQFTFLSNSDELTRYDTYLWFKYVENGAEEEDKYKFCLDFYKDDDTEPFKKDDEPIIIKSAGKSVNITQELGKLSEDEWALFNHGSKLKIKLRETN